LAGVTGGDRGDLAWGTKARCRPFRNHGPKKTLVAKLTGHFTASHRGAG
jgi:hypothetical protein